MKYMERFDSSHPHMNAFRLWLADRLNGAYTFDWLDRWLYPRDVW